MVGYICSACSINQNHGLPVKCKSVWPLNAPRCSVQSLQVSSTVTAQLSRKVCIRCKAHERCGDVPRRSDLRLQIFPGHVRCTNRRLQTTPTKPWKTCTSANVDQQASTQRSSVTHAPEPDCERMQHCASGLLHTCRIIQH